MNLNSTINEDKVYRHLSNSNKINGIVHISHGMAEHIGRYKWLIKKLNNDGFHVIAIDHRGHGKRINNSLKGYFADKNGWDLVLEDLISLISDTKKEFPNHKQFLIGHSMGSWISLGLIQKGISLDGLVLSGSSMIPISVINTQRIIIRLQMLFFGKKAIGKFLDKITLGQYNKFFKPNRTEKDWISSDDENVDDYIKDPLCGYPVTIGLWDDLSRGMLSVFDCNQYEDLNKSMPVYIISGSKDPVGGNGSGVKKLFNFLNTIFNFVQLDLIENARHEVFSETDKENTYNKLLKFFNKI
tara:strand:- start:548 stop:1444 length:897 start_codon:yes stop_codon:yes gene_type:complete